MIVSYLSLQNKRVATEVEKVTQVVVESEVLAVEKEGCLVEESFPVIDEEPAAKQYRQVFRLVFLSCIRSQKEGF